MKFTPDACPKCTSPASGIVETVMVTAVLNRRADGRYEYGGFSNVQWDSQEPVYDAGKVTLMCDCGSAWPATLERDS